MKILYLYCFMFILYIWYCLMFYSFCTGPYGREKAEEAYKNQGRQAEGWEGPELAQVREEEGPAGTEEPTEEDGSVLPRAEEVLQLWDARKVQEWGTEAKQEGLGEHEVEFIIGEIDDYLLVLFSFSFTNMK